MEILIATHNLHKKEEIQQILGSQYIVTSLSDYNLNEEIIEDGSTFQENALIKAKYCYEKTGKASVGDDSGLVVEALDGRPGIYSARYAGNHNFKKNIEKVLEELKGQPNRRAYFITVLCFKDQDGEHYFEGRVYGNITKEVFGEDGFGYDPIFIADDHNMTFAEMLPEEKNKISHRSEALKKFIDYLNSKGGVL
ncbi:RdgB/HAM1 family non-canonical purine NTP pyrophosphatase [Epilithonimonas tenax]|uniref:RdgB/HAM1 family non-canonical purine NTP pyrophosphatase n=1 Tax=Epilithonimonas tenax TaxID=191577 RepID=UPI0003F640C5|nr:RdgB/HAM1 family non-canonical purine NTP pyrophosphatase [Epilithonimonas tenax]